MPVDGIIRAHDVNHQVICAGRSPLFGGLRDEVSRSAMNPARHS
jgi:hypothetical protein